MKNKKIIWTDEVGDRNEKIINFPSLTSAIKTDAVIDANNQLLEDIISKLNIELAEGIVGIATFSHLSHLINCKYHAYIELGSQLADCFGDFLVCDESTYYIDENGDFCFDAITGVSKKRNFVKFRKWKSTINDLDKHRFAGIIRKGALDEKAIGEYTDPIGSYINDILGGFNNGI